MVDSSPYDGVFWPIFGGGLALSFVMATAAAWSRGFLIPLILLPISVLSFWITIFLGSDLGYRAWQQIPNPPDEAYSDAAPAGLLILGWIPGGMFCSLVFGLNWLIRLPLLLGKTSGSQNTQVVAATETGDSTNPFR
ncbi:MAG: hypothetical protein VX111_03715, partial [Planctomycetota bacterium]|nr:hypothetical protein [Planctomycetota bacterium]MEC8160211.1 hypothetical protein [Planctomycetota bacterium]